MAVSTDLLIPEKVYVKFQRRKRDGDDLLLGFMTPYDENDSKFKDRKYTVDRWSNHRNKKSIIDRQAWVGYNEPMTGFEVLHTVSRYRTSNKVWRIKDPRGFELEISSWNLSQMLRQVTIENGVIQNECVWCRNRKGDNWLIPTDSEDYREAQEYTEVRNTRISLRDVNRGDFVTLHDGRTIKYLGGFYYPHVEDAVLQSSSPLPWSVYYPHVEDAVLSAKRRYFFLVPDEDGEYTRLDSKSSIKVGDLVEEADQPLSKAEAEDVANEAMRLSTKSWRARPLFLSASKFDPADVEVLLEDYEIPEDFDDLMGDGGYRSAKKCPVLVADIPKGKISEGEGFYLLKDKGRNHYGENAVYHYEVSKIDREKFFSSLCSETLTRQVQSTRNTPWANTYYDTIPIVAKLPVEDTNLAQYDWKQAKVRVKGKKVFPLVWGVE